MTLPYQTLRILVDHESAIGHARRTTAQLAKDLALESAVADRAALIVTELATNVLRHAGGGDVFIQGSGNGLEIVAVDNGPGVGNVALAMQDGYSTAGTAGNGLGAVQRNATSFELFSRSGKGAVAAARVYPETPSAMRAVGALCTAMRGETDVGDGWCVRRNGPSVLVTVVDGLGHGTEAAKATSTALRVVQSADPNDTLEQLGTAVHGALRSTRGAAVALARIDTANQTLTFLGIGNIAGTIFGEKRQSLASLNGTMGGTAPKMQRFSYAMPRDATLVMSTDGIVSRWSLDDVPGIWMRDPLVIAGLMQRDFQRGHDDATVVVFRGDLA